MTVTTLTLPMPPSVNNLFLNAKRGRVPSPRYTQWRTDAGIMVNAQRPRRIPGPVALEYSIGTDTRSDLANTEKALTDMLVSSNLIDGDDRKTIKQVSLWWGEHTGVHVTIRSVG